MIDHSAGLARVAAAHVAYRADRAAARSTPAPGPYESPPYSSHDAFLAPMRRNKAGESVDWKTRPWEGVATRKPWDYRVTAAIVHLDQFAMLAEVIATLRAQTIPPFIHVIDNGSNAATRAKLEELELTCDDLRIDYWHPRAWETTSQPVAAAMDAIFANVPMGTEFVYATHVDVFLKSPKYLEFLISHCDAKTPVVGYQMSPRAGGHAETWHLIPSHTATMYHMPTMRRIGASWSMQRAAERLGIGAADFRNISGYPDTETNLGLDLVEHGIGMRWLAADGSDPDKPGPDDPPSWLCIGPEPNEPYETPWLVHERSFTSRMLYAPAGAEARQDRVTRALADSRARVAAWTMPAAPPEVARERTANPHQARVAEARRCRHRSDAKTCGCQAGQARCAINKGSFEGGALAVLSDCLTCPHKEDAMRLVDVGDGVWVGNWECCGPKLAEFPLSIHFRYASGHGPMCDRVVSGQGDGLEVVYSDGDSLATLSVPLADLMAYCRRPGRILIHCAAGQTRSPTLAILAKMARGRDRFESIAEVLKAVWDGYGVGIGLHPRPLTELLAWKD